MDRRPDLLHRNGNISLQSKSESILIWSEIWKRFKNKSSRSRFSPLDKTIPYNFLKKLEIKLTSNRLNTKIVFS